MRTTTAEAAKLLYVAMTRATEYLVMTVTGEALMFPSVNPLHHMVMIAELNRVTWLKSHGGKGSVDLGKGWLVPLPQGAESEPFPLHEGRPIYPKIETAGIVGAYQHIDSLPGYEVIFCNDLAYETPGIDIVAKHRHTGRYLVCEAKGTTNEIGSPASYLKLTKSKGRQLSWQWVWRSLVYCADSPAASSVFLELYRPMILEQGIERLLCVTKVDSVLGGFILAETRAWEEKELASYTWFSVSKNWGKLCGWLMEMDNYPNKG